MTADCPTDHPYVPAPKNHDPERLRKYWAIAKGLQAVDGLEPSEYLIKLSERDRATLEAIGSIYCRRHHRDIVKDGTGLCASCREAVEATLERAQSCPNGHRDNCQDCSVKCQRGEGQQRIREIMRYAAPRMLFRHPLMTFVYLRKRLRSR